jgi:hypothetical protein
VTEVSRKAAAAIWKFRFVLSGLVLLVTGGALSQLGSLDVSNSLEVWYPEDDPELVNYRAFQDTYGSDEIIVVAVAGDSRFDDDDGVEQVAGLTDRLLDIPGVATVTSLVTVPESLAAARGRLLSADGRTTALIVQTLTGPAIEAGRSELLNAVRSAVDEFGLVPHLGGYGVVFEGLNEASTTGASTLIVSAHAVMIVLLTLLFRRPGPVLLTLVAVAIATAWTMALYALTGHDLNMVTMVLPTLVLVIGIADCMHLLRSVAAEDRSLARRERVINGLAAVIGPCALMTVTTAAGFFGLTASGLPVVQQLGWFGAFGVLAAFVVSVVLVTAGLSWQFFEVLRQPTIFDRLAKRLLWVGSGHPAATIAVFSLLSVVALYGITALNSDTDSIGYMKPSHVIRRDSDFIEREIGAYVPVEFTVTASDTILTEASLDAVWRWQQRAAALHGVDWNWSLISALGVDQRQLPSEVGLAALRARLERMRQFSRTTVAAMMSGDRQLRVSFGAPIMSARSVQGLIARITAEADLPANLSLRAAGYSPLYTRIVDEIVSSQVRGFAAAIVMIVALIGLAMRSWRRTLLALPANAVPVMLTLGLMGLTGIPLDVASATIASVILGLVVDDTVHLLRPGPDDAIGPSLDKAVGRVGGTLIMTSLVLAAGFLVLGLAEIRSIAWFGVLTSFAVLTAVVADLTLLPAISSLGQRHRKPVKNN